MHLPHPLGITAGQVVIHRHHVNPAASEGVEIAGQGGHEGFALAGFHLSDLAVVQHHAADHLHVEVAHAQHAFAGFAHHGEGLGQQLIEQLALTSTNSFNAAATTAGVLQLLAKLGCEAAQIVVREGSNLLLEQVDVGDNRLVALQLAGIRVTQQELEHGGNGYQSSGGSLLRAGGSMVSRCSVSAGCSVANDV